MTTKTSTEAPADRTLVLTRIFDAPRHLVFEAWTKKEHLDRWCAPHGFTITKSSGEFRPGGGWDRVMAAPDGEKLEVCGIYEQIVPDELLVFTHGWIEDDGTRPQETTVTIRFADEGDKTRMTFEQSNFKSKESRDGHDGGWTQAFEKLAAYVAELQKKGKS
jgi:uncharacterized protein YndB with AHSA1/START domain